jgi:DNA-binding Lrp family transcriptional regulator
VEVVRDTVRVLREAGTPLPRREVAARLEIQPWAASYRLDKAIELKFAEKVGGGCYRVSDVVPEF